MLQRIVKHRGMLGAWLVASPHAQNPLVGNCWQACLLPPRADLCTTGPLAVQETYLPGIVAPPMPVATGTRTQCGDQVLCSPAVGERWVWAMIILPHPHMNGWQCCCKAIKPCSQPEQP
jgi:hypothetical protein